jgi:hypothetical protein
MSYEKVFKVSALTFNVSGVNLNPFEFWSDMTNPDYVSFMVAFEQALNNADDTTTVGEIFTQKMFDKLKFEMEALKWVGVDETRDMYESDFSKKTIISGFLKDKLIGKKRLVSFPDRYTNTIDTSGTIVCRPTLINQHIADFDNLDEWFDKWLTFMFATELDNDKRPCTLLSPIKKNKYPDITENEERISLPLQTLCLAIFDAVLVHLADSTCIDWRHIKTGLLDTLIRNKTPRLVEILSGTYSDVDVMFLQECSSSFIKMLRDSPLGQTHKIMSCADDLRNQMSVVVTKKSMFTHVCNVTDLTNYMSLGLAEGDLLAVIATHTSGRQLLLCSFHGDSEGLRTIPTVNNVNTLSESLGTGLVFGLDANTTADTLGAFQNIVSDCNLMNIWRDEPCVTTYNARTSLQPQFNKATSLENLHREASKNPKDHIIGTFCATQCYRDNTGNREFVDQPFPSPMFPSDHAIVSGDLFMA